MVLSLHEGRNGPSLSTELVSPSRFPHAARYVITSFTAISPSMEELLNATKWVRLSLNSDQTQQHSQ